MKIIHRLLPMLTLMACFTSAFANGPNTDVGHRLAYLSIIAKGAKVACVNDKYGNATCAADGYQIAFGDCNDGFSYGGIAIKGGVTLVDQVSAGHGQPVAQLQDKQFVCIEATASKGGTQRDFVKAVPVASVAGCKNSDSCKIYGDRPIQWIARRSGNPCKRRDSKDYEGDCAAGWIDSDALEEFSMGL